MEIYLKTDRMIFQEFEKNDHILIKELDSDPDVMRYISNGIPSDEKEVNRAMNIFLTFNKRYNYELGYWKVLDKDTSEFMGWFHLRPLKSNLEALENIELGYRLKKKFWGKGYATEGSLALIEKAKDFSYIKKIWAQAMKKNTSSINVMKKVGMKFNHDDIYDQWPGEDKESVWYVLEFKN
jgi:RimJ/RimL family protein N-acetyltransferase